MGLTPSGRSLQFLDYDPRRNKLRVRKIPLVVVRANHAELPKKVPVHFGSFGKRNGNVYVLFVFRLSSSISPPSIGTFSHYGERMFRINLSIKFKKHYDEKNSTLMGIPSFQMIGVEGRTNPQERTLL